MADYAYPIFHITESNFWENLNTHLTHTSYWKIPTPPSDNRHTFNIMLHTKRLPVAWQAERATTKIPSMANGKKSAHGLA